MTGAIAMTALAAASFVTSSLSAAAGIGGGLGLLAVMPTFIPMNAVIPLHGLIQFVSNGSRFALDHKSAECRLLPAYLAGALLGACAGYFLIGRMPTRGLSLLLGVFILLCTWTDLAGRLGKVIAGFFSLGLIQTFLSLFVASVGTLSQPILIRQGLSRDRVIVTHAMQMSVLHGLKVAAFVLAGFSFFRYCDIALAMMGASAVGSHVGGFARHRIPEKLGLRLIKGGVTFFAITMILHDVG